MRFLTQHTIQTILYKIFERRQTDIFLLNQLRTVESSAVFTYFYVAPYSIIRSQGPLILPTLLEGTKDLLSYQPY